MHNNILLRNGLLIDGAGAKEADNISVSILNGKIASVFKGNDEHMNCEYDRIIELNGLTILPGFINSHAHSGFKHVKNEPLRDFQLDYLRACINEGITTVRDEGMLTDDPIKDAIEKKRMLDETMYYPRIITTGKFFSAPGGYGGMEPISIRTEEEARNKVNEVLDKGIDMIKTVLEDGLDPSTFGLPKLSDGLLKAICDEAHKRGARVSAHVTQAHNLKRLVDAGIDDAGHIVYDDLSDELIQEMVAKKVYVVPTLTVLKMINDKYGVPVLEKGMENVYRFVQMGGKIGLGDDFLEEEMPWYRPGMPMLELQLLKEAGLTNMQIIVAATRHGAEICGIDKEVGTIEAGKRADMLIVEGNPLKNLECISNVKMVIKDGSVVVEK
ncbi:MAG: amidohydrolase family protein [Lutispora sp.]|uniref:amidohydrolase family protein n=1 Tax=Lutispora sp. TaxID=2828727 RepID=UPI00356602DE